RGAGFMQTLLLQRTCSSTVAGLSTAETIARHYGLITALPAAGASTRAETLVLDDDEDQGYDLRDLGEPSGDEIVAMTKLLDGLREAVARPANGDGADPKLQVLRHFLVERRWLRGWG